MVDEDVLEKVYQERLEERIIAHLAQVKNCSLELAMDLYYRSKLADKVHQLRLRRGGVGDPSRGLCRKNCRFL